MRRAVRLGAALVVVALGLVLGAGPAAAASLSITAVDVAAFPVVTARVRVTGQVATAADFNVQEAGLYVQTTDRRVLPRTTSTGLVLVVDTSASMTQGDRLGQVRSLARRLVAQKASGDQIAVVGVGTVATVLADLTADGSTLNGAIDRLLPNGESALNDGIRLGAGLLAPHPDLQPNLLVVTDGRDKGSTGSANEARATVLSAHAAVHVLGLVGAPDFDPAPLRSLGSVSGGTYLETRDVASIADIGSRIQNGLVSDFAFTYTSSARSPFDLVVSLGTLQATMPAVTPASLTPATTLTEETTARSLGPLRTGAGPVIVAVLLFAAVGVAGFALLHLVVPARHEMEDTLGGYSLVPTVVDEADGDGSVISTPILRRAVALTERMAERRGALVGIEDRLEMANLKLRAGEVALFTVVLALLLGIALSVLASPVVGLLAGVLGLGLPYLVLNVLASRRRKRFTSQLPDTLNLLAAVLRSGYAVLQGIDAVSTEVQEPMGGELRRVLAEARLGRDVADALKECAERMESPDFDWAVMAIAIQREVGGNLAELLSTVAETMVMRERLRREVQGLTAEGRVSAYVLSLLTPGVALAMFTLNPVYLDPLFHQLIGQILLGSSIFAAVFGFWWMNKMIQIDV